MSNNNIIIGVKITTPPTMIAHSDDHTRNMWEMRAERERLSGKAIDYFTVRFHESAYSPPFLDNKASPEECRLKEGDIVELVGEIYSNDSLNRKRRFAHIYADQIELTNSVKENFVQLRGHICTKVNVYKNPRNSRKSANFKLSVKSKGGRHYINVIASGELADVIDEMETDRLVEVCGRLQYREYAKESNGVMQIRAIYEVAAKKIVSCDLKENAEDDHSN